MNLPTKQIVKTEELMVSGLTGGSFQAVVEETGYHGSVVWDIIRFLTHYGWLRKDGVSTAAAVLEAIAKYKARYGKFSNILQAMRHARCGFPDFHALSEDLGNPWLRAGITRAGITKVRWTIDQGLPGWDRERQLELTRKAIQAWQDVCGLQTEYVPPGSTGPDTAPHVSIGLCSRNNGSDGRGGMLAYTYLPTYRPHPIPLLFDVSETFVNSVPRHGDILYLNTCSHELGHVLCGLDHSPAEDNQPALMDPYYNPDVWKPQQFDIKRALKMWPKSVTPSVPVPTEPNVIRAVYPGGVVVESPAVPSIAGYSVVKK